MKNKYLENIDEFLYDGKGPISYIYFILNLPYKNSKGHQIGVKIGYSTNPDRRLANLQTGTPGELVLWYSFPVNKCKVAQLEHSLHKKFAWSNTRGEWFKMRKCIRVWVSTHKKRVISEKKRNRHRKERIIVRVPRGSNRAAIL